MALAPELQAAHALFLQELEKHLAFFDATLAESAGLDAKTAEELEKLRRTIQHRFHTVRGGAGFFKLDRVVAVSAKGEKLFQSLADKEAITSALLAELPQLVSQLKTAHQEDAAS